MKKIGIIIGVFCLLLLANHICAGVSKSNMFEKLLALHKTKIPPGPYDWLARHHEEGQTFEQYVSSDPVLPDEKRKAIYIMLLGDFDATRSKIIEQTAKFIEVFYGLPVKFAESIPLSSIPSKARRVHPQTSDKQILTSYIIEEVLKSALPKDAFCLIAFTSSDLWPGAGWNFVFGQASIDDRVGVWSIYRNGDPATSKDDYKLCLKRTIKTGVHEIGHMFSFHHCIYYECLMNGSNHRKESDSRPLWLCPVCLRKLAWGLKTDIFRRFEDLADISREFGFDAEELFYKKTLKLKEE